MHILAHKVVFSFRNVWLWLSHIIIFFELVIKQSENLFQPGSLQCCSCILFASALEQPAVEKHLQAKY